jgi:hypothetical protein
MILSNQRGVKLELLAIRGETGYLRETVDLLHPQCPVILVRGRGNVAMRSIEMPVVQLRDLFGEKMA